MKRTMKRMKLSLIVTFAVIVLASSLEAGYANAAINEQKEDSSTEALPDFLLRLSEYLSKGDASELARIRREMIEQEKIKQDMIESTNGAVLHPSLPTGPLAGYYWPQVMMTIEGTSPPMYDIYGNLIGHIDNAHRLKGWPDSYCALLETFGWNQDYEHPEGGEACAAGYMSYWTIGNIYIYARKGPNAGSVPPWFNYVIVWVADYYYGTWHYVGYAPVSSSSLELVYIGTWWNFFSCIAVTCWTPPQAPIPYEPDIFNSVLIDSVIAW